MDSNTQPLRFMAFVSWPRPDLDGDTIVMMAADPDAPTDSALWQPVNLGDRLAVEHVRKHAEVTASATGSVGATVMDTVLGVRVSVQWMRRDPRLADWEVVG